MLFVFVSGVHVCWSEHSDSSFVYGFMILDYGFGTMTATTFLKIRLAFRLRMTRTIFPNSVKFVLSPF